MTYSATQRTTPGPLVGLALTGPLGAWLAVRAADAGHLLAGPAGTAGPGDLAALVAVVLLWTGCAAAAWYFVTCAAIVMVHLAHTVGAGTAGLERAVRRWGFPVLRRTLLSTVAAGAGLTLTVGAASATQSTPEVPVPHDLGWGASSITGQPPVGEQVAEAIMPAGETAAGSDTDRSSAAATTSATPGTAALQAVAEPSAGVATEPSSAGGAAGPPAGARSAQASSGTSATLASSTATRRPATPAAPTATALPAARPAPDAETARSTYVVLPGDTLWSIAEKHLGPTTTDADVTQAWPEWYAANLADVGPDPHLIHPGQLLQVPDEEAS